MSFLVALGCASPGGGLGTQPAIQAHLVLHMDPMVRADPTPCSDPALTRCGRLSLEPWRRRTQNLTWLADNWVPSSRTVDLQLGPESALAWAGHPGTLAVLGEDARETADRGMCALHQLVDSERASLGLHMHGVMPDGDGRHGELNLVTAESPCGATQANPIEEVDPSLVEALVHYGATSVHPLASMLGHPIDSFTAHVPRSMETKILVLEDPDGIDPLVQRAFPQSFQPRTLGSAYSECYQQAVGHPVFEVYPADPILPLGAGQGPPIIPGNRVVGSMASHLGADQDGSVGAARRRLVQLLLNWRVAGLRGESDRPWVYTFHAHLFDLGAGAPDPWIEEDRQRDATAGQAFRGDILALSETLDQLASRSAWRGVGGDDGVLKWSLPRDLEVTGSRFSVDPSADGAYLPLVTERLGESHLRCAVTDGDFDLFVLDRCPGGWAWGGEGFGQHCADLAPKETVTVVVSDVGGCMQAETDGLIVGAVDGSQMTPPERCDGGLSIPQAGLIVERADGLAWLDGPCESGLHPVLAR